MAIAAIRPPVPHNDVTERARIWRRFAGDEWDAFDRLPASIRRRMHEHAYDAWAVNALILWRLFRRQLASSARGERRLSNHLDDCERIEREAFAAAYARDWGGTLPHLAAGASVLRYDAEARRTDRPTD